jgi:hypothetical protein
MFARGGAGARAQYKITISANLLENYRLWGTYLLGSALAAL